MCPNYQVCQVRKTKISSDGWRPESNSLPRTMMIYERIQHCSEETMKKIAIGLTTNRSSLTSAMTWLALLTSTSLRTRSSSWRWPARRRSWKTEKRPPVLKTLILPKLTSRDISFLTHYQLRMRSNPDRRVMMSEKSLWKCLKLMIKFKI